MKKKLICTLLAFALVLCAMPVAYASNGNGNARVPPGVGNFFTETTKKDYSSLPPGSGTTPPGSNIFETIGKSDGHVAGKASAEDKYDGPELWDDGFSSRWKVWVERSISEDNEKIDKIVMDLVPVDEGMLEEYQRYYEDFTGWDTEGALYYSPAGGFYTNQVKARFYDFEDHHRSGGKLTVEVGLFTERYQSPGNAVYYQHRAFDETIHDYDLAFYVGELKVLVDKEYAKTDLNFAARPDGSGGWEIILKDLDGNDVGYSIV